ncbi:MAG: class I SAM-dependent methyltransferase [Candidatus Marinimicrobia bacterium]|nr:class I SAM-dependent methyltransferase [Candidatus Neomarinimicrobiota bacterium]
MNEFHEANRKGWNAAVRAGFGQVDNTKDWRECYRDASQIFNKNELKWFSDASGKKVCVLGSGDNLAVFALAGLGADVTSVDISEEQLAIAHKRASQLGVAVRFIRSDVTDLTDLNDDTYDIVYTGGHVAVWVSDLWQYYREAVRILKPGGLFVVNEYHPFRRIWKETKNSLEIEFGYFNKGPHQWDRSEEIPDAEPGSLPSYEFHWTVSEYITAVVDAGTNLLLIDEFGDKPQAWEVASLGGLPEALLIVSEKKERPTKGAS